MFVYNGKEQAPKAWFEEIDDNGQTITVALTVIGVGKDVGDGYTASVKSGSDNYALTGDTEVTFKIVASTATEYKWVWDADGNGSWVEIEEELGGDNAEGGDEIVDKDKDDNSDQDLNEGGDGKVDGEQNTTDPEESESGTTPTETVTLGKDPADGEQITTDPQGSGKDEADGEGADGEPKED